MFRVIQWAIIVFAVLWIVINVTMIAVMGRVLAGDEPAGELGKISEALDITQLNFKALEIPIRNWLIINFIASALNILMSCLVGYAAYFRERMLMVIWLYYEAVYTMLSVFNVLPVRDWCSAFLVFNIYFWILVFEFQRKLKEVHSLKVAMLNKNSTA